MRLLSGFFPQTAICMVRNEASMSGYRLAPSSDNRSVAMPPPNIDLPDGNFGVPFTDVDENRERGNWSSGVEFLLSCLSYAVGLGNIWRFPYLCYRNGGGAFLIPYVIMMLFVGLPLFLMELSFGQYASEGPVTIWKICPLFQGLGYAMFIMSGLVGIYYNMILAWALFYLLSSFTTHLPWSSCDNWWNTEACRKFDTKNCTSHNGTVLSNGTCVQQVNVSPEDWAEFTKHNSKMASDEYFHNFVLGITDGLHDLGGMRWQLALCLFACWSIVLICLLRGVKSMGKVVYFTALFPYLVLIILLIRGTTLEGSYDGIMFYLTPEWERLLDAKVWGDAAMQIFFSLSPCWGGLITLASYNRFHNNCFKDALFITFGNSATSFFAGFVIFSIVGFMAHEMGVPVKEVAAQGAGLAFIAYPEAVARLPVSPLWAFLFFFMLLTLGLGTQFTLIETVSTSIVDTFPERLRRAKSYVVAGVCLVSYLCGLVICTKGGMYVLQLMDNYCASFSALIIGFVEVIVIGWVYGAERFLNDMKVMMGFYPYPYHYWRIVWKFVVPALIGCILIFSCMNLKPTEYGEYVYPNWATAVGWIFSLISVAAIPFVVVLKICQAKGPILQRIRVLLEPTEDWGPKLQMHRMETHSPKHTDSQVPLALPNYDPDGYGDNDFGGDNLGSKLSIGDDSNSEFEGLRLNIPSHVTETGV
ncbi:sodium- and chloride-dependent glycine transporter 1 isoform X3 [Parasteatoda tepidariorum]|uniref:sodium- and chloride-dependent glycine transporter 1 isoform X3 n=1 Tax=Parasteatoda tepidariorum TaxID=114398 RepID=UPI00077FC34F|nr:sodium- and chloride-dependent glycine transporter 1 isoform X3 [Parasteatoda tepidariorum]